MMEEGGAMAEKGGSAGSRVRKIYKDWERRGREKKGAIELVFVLERGKLLMDPKGGKTKKTRK